MPVSPSYVRSKESAIATGSVGAKSASRVTMLPPMDQSYPQQYGIGYVRLNVAAQKKRSLEAPFSCQVEMCA